MKKRKHVSLREESRHDGKTQYILTWTPEPGNRCRKIFSDPRKANQRADELEETLGSGFKAVAALPRWRWIAINALLNLLPNDSGATLHRIVLAYLDNNGITGQALATAKEVGTAYMKAKETTGFLNQKSVKQHITKFIGFFGERPYASIEQPEYTSYLKNEVGGAGKTQNNHLINLKAMSRWARDIGMGKLKYLPPGVTAAEQVATVKVDTAEHDIYTPDQFKKLLVFTPAEMVPFMVIGQFAGIRAAERCRLRWEHWREAEGNTIVLNPDVTKTKRKRIVPVEKNLTVWLKQFRGDQHTPIVSCNAEAWATFQASAKTPKDTLALTQATTESTYKRTAKIAAKAKLPWLDNALRSGYVSLHLELYSNDALTAKNAGHSVDQMEDYKSIAGVTKAIAEEMFSITPASVVAYAAKHNLPRPAWAVG